jgi:hypothetical protein
MAVTNPFVRTRAFARRFGIALALMSLAATAAGCAKNPFPSSLTPKSCPGDPCGLMNCPNGFVCSVDAQCGAHCEAQPLGNRSL